MVAARPATRHANRPDPAAPPADGSTPSLFAFRFAEDLPGVVVAVQGERLVAGTHQRRELFIVGQDVLLEDGGRRHLAGEVHAVQNQFGR